MVGMSRTQHQPMVQCWNEILNSSPLEYTCRLCQFSQTMWTERQKNLHGDRNARKSTSQNRNSINQRMTAMLLSVTFTFVILTAPKAVLFCIRNEVFMLTMWTDSLAAWKNTEVSNRLPLSCQRCQVSKISKGSEWQRIFLLSWCLKLSGHDQKNYDYYPYLFLHGHFSRFRHNNFVCKLLEEVVFYNVWRGQLEPQHRFVPGRLFPQLHVIPIFSMDHSCQL
jgi:hypothetical protein